MGKIIGIDIGGSTTKIIGLEDGQIFSPMLVRANDPVASVYGAFGKFLSTNQLQIGNIDRVMITGVGASFVKERLYGIPTGKVDEFRAIGIGGLFLAGLKQAIIVSMGTGTAMVRAEGDTTIHIGGTGVGGGTLLGLSNRMLNVRDFNDLVDLASSGSLKNVDLSVGDITKDLVPGLPPETTASNFGDLSDLATRSDLALGIVNLVFQTIGMMAVFATRIDKIKDVVITGNLTNVPQGMQVLHQLGKLFTIEFLVPEHAEFATATGAAKVFHRNGTFEEIG